MIDKREIQKDVEKSAIFYCIDRIEEWTDGRIDKASYTSFDNE